jgi:hypothetical protein
MGKLEQIERRARWLGSAAVTRKEVLAMTARIRELEQRLMPFAGAYGYSQIDPHQAVGPGKFRRAALALEKPWS